MPQLPGFLYNRVRLDGKNIRQLELPTAFPKIVCLCGSTRFWRQFQDEGLRLTMEGVIVLSIGAARQADGDDQSFGGFIDPVHFESAKVQLDELHKRKIDLADEIFVLNVGGYVGESTKSEIHYALWTGKPVRWLEKV